MVVEPVANFGNDEDRPQPLQSIGGHARRGKPRGKTQLAAGIIGVAGHGDADIAVADFALVDHEALFHRIELAAHGNIVEDERVALVGRRIQHHGAAADTELPRPRRLRRRFDLAKQRDPIAAGKNLEGHR